MCIWSVTAYLSDQNMKIEQGRDLTKINKIGKNFSKDGIKNTSIIFYS
jgi:hypothetical protein